MSLGRRIWNELRKTADNPSRLRRLSDRRRLNQFLKSLLGATGETENHRNEIPWSKSDEQGRFVSRSYEDYAAYVSHQRSKLATLDLSDYDVRYRQLLAERIRQVGQVEPGARVLCLAARIGTEVKAFHDHGCFAVGIDLNPGDDNPWVLPGDFHDVQFPDASVDVVFTNSLDHALDVERLLGEIRRLLVPDGLLIGEIALGTDEGFQPREYESFFWRSLHDAVELIESQGFEKLSSHSFDEPWPGEHVTFRRVGAIQSGT